MESPRADTSLEPSNGPFETAIEHAVVRVPTVTPGMRLAEVRKRLTGERFDSATHIVVRDGERFAGILRIEDFFAAPDEATVDSLMDHDAPFVAPGVDQEVAAWRAAKHGEAALSVVDREGRFVGIIPPDALLAVLMAEHEEDHARIGGFLKTSSTARRASEEPVQRRFLHRLPWLLLGLAGAIAAADIVGWFEARLADKIVLAFFIPGIVYLADAVGTQTETVVVRGLSVGVPIGRIVTLEVLTGLSVGVVLALLAFPLLWWRWQEMSVALGVSIAVFAACSTATFVAMSLPWVLDKFDVDPAFGSGPLATVIQDLLSILIYFWVVTRVA
jgi:magnesium transporter